jgi:uncharacterized membrane protein YtjA (UPF0391 family)
MRLRGLGEKRSVKSYRRARPHPEHRAGGRELLARALEQEPRLEHEAAAPPQAGGGPVSGARAPAAGRAAFVLAMMLALFVVALVSGCARHPASGDSVPVWQARPGFVPEPVRVHQTLTCRTFEDQSPFDTGTITE